MKIGEKEGIRLRIKIVTVLFLIGFGGVLSRAYFLQIFENKKYTDLARKSYVGNTLLPSKRGIIYDREGHELAISVDVASIYAHPNRVKDKRHTAQKLARILRLKQKNILRCLKSDKSFVWIKRRIPPEQAQEIKEETLKGVYITTEPKRYYPCKENGAHFLGFVGSDNQGLEGLEKKFDSYLRGPQGKLVLMRDAKGRSFSMSPPIYSEGKMHDLVLTIDKDIQFKAQAALRSAVKEYRAKSGSCIVTDPHTGEILAMAVSPEFNPNVFNTYNAEQWRNRAVTDCYEPGSVIKTFLLAACLEKHVVTPSTRIDCEQGEFKIGSNVIHDTKEHGIISVTDIIMHSSNIGGVKMGQRIGYKTFHEYLKNFGFGTQLGNDFLGQRKGYIRPVEKAKPIDQATLYFGQGMSGTPLQTTMAMAAIANGGKLMRPYVVKAIIDESGHVVEETKPHIIRQVISKETAQKVSRILETVVTEDGTASQASIAGFSVGGKTGTSQKVDPRTRRYSWSKYVATFVGFAPADNPRLVIFVAVDEPRGVHYGGLVAGPVFREVGQWSMNYLRINPVIRAYEEDKNNTEDDDPPKTVTCATVQPCQAKEGTLPDFRGLGMRAVLNKGRSLGLKVVLEGTGVAVKQTPLPGKVLKKIQIVKVHFEPPA